jgi:hypothetical protein
MIGSANRLVSAALVWAIIVPWPVATGAEEVPPPSSRVAELRAAATAFEHGEGVGKDPLRAAHLYCEAATLGDAESQFDLGWMYANGRGVPRDDRIAATLFQLATDRGHERARNMLRYVGEPGDVPECMILQPAAGPGWDDDGDLPGVGSPERRKIVEMVRRIAPEFRISPRLVLAVIGTESAFNPAAVSPKNAQGLMQLIPETSERFNVRKPFDPVQNLRGGLAYLRWLLAYYEGNVALAAAGYNAGEKAVDRYRGIPPYAETQAYVRRILALVRDARHPFESSVTAPSPELKRILARGGDRLAGAVDSRTVAVRTAAGRVKPQKVAQAAPGKAGAPEPRFRGDLLVRN